MCQNDIEVCGYGNVPQTTTTGRHRKHRIILSLEETETGRERK